MYDGASCSADFAPKLRNLRQRYRGEVRFTDCELAELVQGLRAAGLWDESVVVVLSDHGEAFGEHDSSGHGGPEARVERGLDERRAREEELGVPHSDRSGLDPQTRELLENLGYIE